MIHKAYIPFRFLKYDHEHDGQHQVLRQHLPHLRPSLMNLIMSTSKIFLPVTLGLTTMEYFTLV